MTTTGAATTTGGSSGSFHVSGVAQKGPFEAGATVTLQELDDGLNPTGQTFTVETTDNSGSFAIPPAVSANFIEVLINGYFFDEVWADAQPAQATLHAYADLQASQATVNVNLITHLQGERLQLLLDGGSTFSEAQQQSTQEVLAAFNIPSQFVSDFTQATLTAGSDESAILLATSVIILNAAYQGNTATVEADAVEFIDQFRLAMQSGAPSSSIAAAIAAAEQTFTCSQMNDAIERLSTYYSSFGVSFPPPPAEDFIDPGWTGTINRLRDAGADCCPVSDAGNDCGGVCFDFQGDPENCGGCGMICPSDGTCSDGGCVCLTQANPYYCSESQICTDLQTDRANCGECGGFCPAGSYCDAGVCDCPGSPGDGGEAACSVCLDCLVTLASNQDGLHGLTIDATSVYWTTSNSVMSVQLDGGGARTLATNQDAGPGEVVVDAQNAYWVNSDGTIRSVPLDGGSINVLASGAAAPFGIAIDANNIYWTTGAGIGGDAGTIMSCQHDGGSPKVIAAGLYGPSEIKVDSSFAYWTDNGDVGGVSKVPIDGGAVITLTLDSNVPAGIAIDANNVYWVDGAGVMSMPIDGGPISVLAAGQTGAYGLTVDTTSIYWVDFSGTLMTMFLDGGNPTLLMSDLIQPNYVVVDSTSAYWLSGSVVQKLTPK